MAHHGNDISEQMRELFNPDPKHGATGEFPRGKIAPEDEGGIRFGVAADKGKVLLDFGKPVAWIGMDPEDAYALAETLKRKADEAALAR